MCRRRKIPASQLGIALGVAARAGRDKVTILASPGLADFGAWAEQLFAESTGKNGKGLIPVDGEPLGAPEVYGDDRVFIDLRARRRGPMPDARPSSTALREGRPSGRAHRAEIARTSRPGILPLGDRDRGRRRGDRHQSVRSARRRSEQDQDPRADRRLREDRRAAGRNAGRAPAKPSTLYTDEANAEALRARRRRRDARKLAQGASRPHRRRRLRRAARLYRARRANIDALAERCGSRCATSATSRPASGSARAFCIRPGRPTKAARTAACFLQITADDAEDLAIPGHRASFGVVEGGAGARRFRRAARARPARAARPSRRRCCKPACRSSQAAIAARD